MLMPQTGPMPATAPTTAATSDGGGGAAPPMQDDPEAIKDYLFDHDLVDELQADLESVETGEVFVAAPIRVEYIEDDVAAGEERKVTETAPPVLLDLLPHRHEEIVQGTLRFEWGGVAYWDRRGTIYREDDDGEEVEAGAVDYEEGTVELTEPGTAGGAEVHIERMVTTRETPGEDSLYFRLPGAPVRPGTTSIMATTVAGDELVATADADGGIRGDYMSGYVDHRNGLVYLSFQETVPKDWESGDDGPPWYHDGLDVETEEGTYVRRPIRCQPQAIRFSTVLIDYLPLEADTLGLDPVRLPQDGRVPWVRAGDVIVFADTDSEELEDVEAGKTYELSRDDLGYIELRDYEDYRVDAAMYETDLQAGKVTITDEWDPSDYLTPIRAIHRKEEMRMVADVEITGRVQVTPQMKRGFPAGTTVSSALIIGDLNARVPLAFEQASWDPNSPTWQDSVEGDEPTGRFDRVNYPIEVTNRDSIDERWAIHFTSEDEFEVIGEHLGMVTKGDINADVQPTNPATGEPYFIMRSEGFGTGWAPGNVIRFNTKAAHYPVWLLRCVQQGESEVRDDEFTLQLRGDAQ